MPQASYSFVKHILVALLGIFIHAGLFLILYHERSFIKAQVNKRFYLAIVFLYKFFILRREHFEMQLIIRKIGGKKQRRFEAIVTPLSSLGAVVNSQEPLFFKLDNAVTMTSKRHCIFSKYVYY